MKRSSSSVPLDEEVESQRCQTSDAAIDMQPAKDDQIMDTEPPPPTLVTSSTFLSAHQTSPLPIIDLRSPSEFTSSRLTNLSSPLVNLPFPSLLSSGLGCSLPPRSVPFDLILPSSPPPLTILSFFTSKLSSATNSSRTPWLVRNYIITLSTFSTEFLTDVPQSIPGPRLWKPSVIVEEVLCEILREGGEGSVVDLGSGAGRDVAFLAENFPNSHFYGIDNHKGSSKRCLPLWCSRGVSETTHLVNINLKKLDVFFEFLEGQRPVRMCYAVRYLNRPLMAELGKSMREGEVFAIEHFVVNEDGSFPFDHPRIAEVLQLDEMERFFPEKDWTVLHKKIVKDSDAGRSLLNFCVRRK
ncbi:hypothetical protein TrST_g6732 [Triparma strigata]|uniref:Methyltransferase domain-containing protein n=1 Tax=Triparma strigata TaxID=1606541 RepID=A0A9W7F1I7_9STRA|nr:hypothetical protein TrST_g6732 [Triparma strigata]